MSAVRGMSLVREELNLVASSNPGIVECPAQDRRRNALATVLRYDYDRFDEQSGSAVVGHVGHDHHGRSPDCLAAKVGDVDGQTFRLHHPVPSRLFLR